MHKNTKISGQPVICQLLSFLPKEIIKSCIEDHQSDYYYKTFKTVDQLAFLLYGVITKAPSLRSLCKNLLFLEDKLLYYGINNLPAVSTFSDANINRKSAVFEAIYFGLMAHYSNILSDSYLSCPINGEVNPKDVKLVDATTVSLFVDIFKAAGRKPANGKKKGGLKVQSCLSLDGLVPEIINLNPSASNDRNFLGQLPQIPGTVYVLDSGYMNYVMFQEWTKQEVYFVTKLYENAAYQVVEQINNDPLEYSTGGVIRDEKVLLQSNAMGEPLMARVITYKSPNTNEVIKFVTNIFDCQAQTIAALYKNRWSIEPFFKKLKQNFELSYFYSDKEEGIKTQIWVVLIANLLFEVIHKQIKEAEHFSTLVSMIATNMGSYISFLSVLRSKKLDKIERDIKIVQLNLFQIKEGGSFEKTEKPP